MFMMMHTAVPPQSETSTVAAPVVDLSDPSFDLNSTPDPVSNLGSGPVDFILRCTDGLFKHRFFYINKSEEGEAMGSDPDPNADLTLYVENSELSRRHAQIKFIENEYILKDIGSETGTFVKVRSDLPMRMERGHVYRFADSPHHDMIVEAVSETSLTLKRLVSGATYQITDSATIGRADCSLVLDYPSTEPFAATIVCVQNIFYIADISSPASAVSCPGGLIKRKLSFNDSHVLIPGDVFRIGKLEFTVFRFNTGIHSDQGARGTMEDTEVAIQELGLSSKFFSSFFGVYDGHGGSACAEYLAAHLHSRFKTVVNETGGLDLSTNVRKDLCSSLRKACLDVDSDFLSTSSFDALASGAAAVCVALVGDRVLAANVGDARAVLCSKGKAIDLSIDHKPDRPDELKRIEQAGGHVTFRRVLGRLAVSRAFGDIEYKGRNPESTEQPLVVADPEIREWKMTDHDEFILLACDGLFDVFTSQDAVDFCRRQLASMDVRMQDPSRVVKQLIDEAIQVRRSRDNVTAILITLNPGITLD
eukprot:GILI01020606.1.p1 GENE.GILI01020606.1~~GILI01020606.1.p1  ORF type:complete len:534 (-),score=101.62 GILI01020606.1:110-1711(-)